MRDTKRRSLKPGHWLIIIILFLLAVLLLQNMEVVTLRVFFWDISMSRIIMFPLILLVGFAAGYTAARFRSRRR